MVRLVELIIFDLGGVIVDFNEEMYVKYMSPKLGIGYNRMHRAVVDNLRPYEIGKINFQTFRKRCLSKMGLNGDTDMQWNSAFLKLARTNKDVERLVRKLHDDYDYSTALITNISKTRYDMACRYKFDPTIFDKKFTSFRLGMAKPSRFIYRRVLDEMNTKPSDAVFIDNLKKNVDGAEAIGIHGIVFKNYRQLANDLGNLGVLK